MNCLNTVFQILKSEDAEISLRAFSRQYCGKNPNWASYQKHKKRDFSLSAALNCLSAIETRMAALRKLKRNSMTKSHCFALMKARVVLLSHIAERHALFFHEGRVCAVAPKIQ